MRGIAVGVQKEHRDYVGLQLCNALRHARRGLTRERAGYALRLDALGHRHRTFGGHQRRRVVGGEVVQRGAILAAQEEQVAEPFRDAERYARPGALEQSVGGHRGAVDETRHVGASELLQRCQHPQALVGRCAEHLAGCHPAVAVDPHQVCERASDVHAHPESHVATGVLLPGLRGAGRAPERRVHMDHAMAQ